MEHVLFTWDYKKYYCKICNKYNRLYFGNEFCQVRIPTLEEVKSSIEFAEDNNLKFTFVTPYVTNNGLIKIKVILDYLAAYKEDIEIVVNDWGVFYHINNHYKKFQVIIGRLLTKQRRGPRILNVMDKISKDALEHFKSSNMDSEEIYDYLSEKCVKRAEFDNLLQGINLEHVKLKKSLYYPYVYVTTTRLCMTNTMGGIYKTDQIGIQPCNRECESYTTYLRHSTIPTDLIVKGNTQFVINKTLPDLEEKDIDRLIYQPEPFA